MSDGPGNYNDETNCWWIISPDNATQIELRFSEFELEGRASCCLGDNLYVYECSDSKCVESVLLDRISGTMATVPPSFVSRTGIMLVNFRTDLHWTRKGFDAVYFTPCPAGTYGPGMPECTKCTFNCPIGKLLITTSCGAIGSTIDNECSCPPDQYYEDQSSSCIQCPNVCDFGIF